MSKAPQRRRQRLLLLVCTWAMIVASLIWLSAHLLLSQWQAAWTTVACLPLAMGVLLALRRQANGLAVLLFSVAAWGQILLISLSLDLPSASVPRAVHHYLLPLFLAQRFLLQGRPAWLHNGAPLVSLLLFAWLHLTGNPFGLMPQMTDEQRVIGHRLVILFCLLLGALVLRLQHIELRERTGLPLALARALADDRLEPRLQAQCDAQLRPLGASLIPHWPAHPAMSATLLRAMAARNGLGLALTQWELRCALSLLDAWREHPGLQGLELGLSLGPASLGDAELLARLLAEADRTGGRLLIGVDESSIAEAQGDGLRATLQACRDAGLRILLDNFGSGRSALSQLDALPVDRLQLDASLVQGVEGEVRGRELLAGVIALGRRLGLQVCAKGATNAAMLQQLRELGCRRFELPGEAMTHDALSDWALARQASP